MRILEAIKYEHFPARLSFSGYGEVVTLFRCRFIEPLASMVAVSPRRETTLPRMRTIWLVNESRYLALMRGVASEAIVDGREEAGGG